MSSTSSNSSQFLQDQIGVANSFLRSCYAQYEPKEQPIFGSSNTYSSLELTCGQYTMKLGPGNGTKKDQCSLQWFVNDKGFITYVGFAVFEGSGLQLKCYPMREAKTYKKTSYKSEQVNPTPINPIPINNIKLDIDDEVIDFSDYFNNLLSTNDLTEKELNTSYFIKKHPGIIPEGCKFIKNTDGTVTSVIPLYDSFTLNTIKNYQQILSKKTVDGKGKFFARHPDPKKSYSTKGLFYPIGNLSIDVASIIYLCEGVATGLSIAHSGREKRTVICAMNSGNLLNVYNKLREYYPKNPVIICADNDQYKAIEEGTSGKLKGNAGLSKAYEILDLYPEHNTRIVFPDFVDPAKRLTDFNDLGYESSINYYMGIARPTYPKDAGNGAIIKSSMGSRALFCTSSNYSYLRKIGIVYNYDTYVVKMSDYVSGRHNHIIKNYNADDILNAIGIQGEVPSIMYKPNISVNSRYLELKLEDIINNKYKVTSIKSPLGTGKTQAVMKLIANTDHSVLQICHLRSLVAGLCEKYNKYASNTRKMDSYVNKHALNSERLGCCLDSINKILRKDYDVIIIDEITQLLNTLVQKGFDGHKEEIFDRFNSLLRNAKHIVAMDADMNQMALQFLTQFGSVNQIVNTYTENKTIIEDGFDNLVRLALESYKKRERVFIASNTVSQLETFIESLRILMPEDEIDNFNNNTICISAKNSSTGKVISILNEPNNIKRYQIVGITPTINSGVSFDSIDSKCQFDLVIGLFGAYSTLPTDCLQQLGRARDFTKAYINFTSKKNHNQHTSQSYNSAMEEEGRLLRKMLKEYNVKITTDMSYIRLSGAYLDVRYFELSNFAASFIKHCTDRKWTFVGSEENYKQSAIITEAKDNVKNNNIMQFVEANNFSKERYEGLKSSIIITESEYWAMVKYDTALAFDLENSPQNNRKLADLYSSYNAIPIYKNFKLLNKNEKELVEYFTKNMESMDARPTAVKLDLLNNLLKCVGLTKKIELDLHNCCTPAQIEKFNDYMINNQKAIEYFTPIKGRLVHKIIQSLAKKLLGLNLSFTKNGQFKQASLSDTLAIIKKVGVPFTDSYGDTWREGVVPKSLIFNIENFWDMRKMTNLSDEDGNLITDESDYANMIYDRLPKFITDKIDIAFGERISRGHKPLLLISDITGVLYRM